MSATTPFAVPSRALSARALLALGLALGTFAPVALAPTPAEARAQTGFCEVYRGTRQIDANTCLAREICYYNETTRGETCRTEYLWPTNATTLVTYESGRPKLVNGAPAESRNVLGRTCALNKVSGNTFCFRRR